MGVTGFLESFASQARTPVLLPLAAVAVLLIAYGPDSRDAAGASPGTTERVSIDSGGNQANFYSEDPALSADGRYVAFTSYGTNLVPGDTNNARDIFVRDGLTGQTERVSVDGDGNQANGVSLQPAVSADGRYVAFTSDATNLALGKGNRLLDVFVKDRLTGQTERISIDEGGGQANGTSFQQDISADGRYVAFLSDASDLVSGDTNAVRDVFVRDRMTGRTERVSVDTNDVQSNGHSDLPAISADARFVTFQSSASNLVPGDTNGAPDIFVRDTQTGQTERVSVDSGGSQANQSSREPDISGNGRYVAFTSAATNLVPSDTNGAPDIFIRDTQTGQTERVSIDGGGNQSNAASYYAAISDDGRHIAFRSSGSNLVPDDTNGYADIFVRDRQAGLTERANVDSAGNQSNTGINPPPISGDLPAISGDARYVAFQSWASDLVQDDTNDTQDIFVRSFAWTYQADLKVTSVILAAPGVAVVGAPFNVAASITLHNNGPSGPVNADTTLALSLPGDCNTSSSNPKTVEDSSLDVSVQVSVPADGASWSVTCSGTGLHTFTADVSVALDQVPYSDGNPANNASMDQANVDVRSGPGGPLVPVGGRVELLAASPGDERREVGIPDKTSVLLLTAGGALATIATAWHKRARRQR